MLPRGERPESLANKLLHSDQAEASFGVSDPSRMKLIRHFFTGAPAYAALQPDGTAHEIAGDIFGDFQLTGRIFNPGKRLAPVTPPNILGIGLNYKSHAADLNRPPPDHPMLFIKSTNTVQHPGDPIEIPRALPSFEVDYEGELAIVIGRLCKNVPRDRALDYVLGYTIANDVTARDWQFKLGGGQFCQGKSFDTFCPLGPVLVTKDELPDPGKLRLRTRVNGEVRQDNTTADMIFDVPALIAFLSASKQLFPGTVILTGTPRGVGIAAKPPVFLQPGDRVEIEIEGIGILSNPVILEPVPA
jgi:2-keto-4-pentenoate hydratase/2-oxohepta-3-ene-1,7-dioic acid hydratase in catechol pathway